MRACLWSVLSIKTPLLFSCNKIYANHQLRTSGKAGSVAHTHIRVCWGACSQNVRKINFSFRFFSRKSRHLTAKTLLCSFFPRLFPWAYGWLFFCNFSVGFFYLGQASDLLNCRRDNLQGRWHLTGKGLLLLCLTFIFFGCCTSVVILSFLLHYFSIPSIWNLRGFFSCLQELQYILIIKE